MEGWDDARGRAKSNWTQLVRGVKQAQASYIVRSMYMHVIKTGVVLMSNSVSS